MSKINGEQSFNDGYENVRHKSLEELHKSGLRLCETRSDHKSACTSFNKSSFKMIPPSSMKYVSLILLMLQNAALVLVMRYSRTRPVDVMYLTTTTVVMGEALKCIACLAIIFFQEGRSISRFLSHLNENIFQQPLDCVKISIPSFIYMLQNNLLYIAVSNLDAATYQVSYQLKILTTAMFSVLMLRKELSRMQWFSLLILFTGVALVQLQPGSTSEADAKHNNPFVGMVAVVISCLMSGFAGVYFEKVLKSTKQSLWIRNVQLGFIGMSSGFVTAYIKDGAQLMELGFFQGYDWVVWCVVLLTSLGGLMVAVVVKYADNILKGFATSAAIVLSSIASYYFFDFILSVQFVIGAGMVIAAVYVYSKFIPKAPSLEKVSPSSV